jgi:predicted enzyme related to lactoylglutathione lyase
LRIEPKSFRNSWTAPWSACSEAPGTSRAPDLASRAAAPDDAAELVEERLGGQGWKAQEEQTPMGPYTAFEDVLIGMTGSRDGVPAGWVPYVNVADVAASTRRVKELGGEILRDCITIPDDTFSVLRDPTGGVLGLFQKKK